MSKNLVPRSFWNFPSVGLPFSWDDDENWSLEAANPSGLTISEDEKNVYVEAQAPGLKPEDFEITFEKGVLWIKAEKKQEEEDKKKKYYRKAITTFSYRVTVPGHIDTNKEPEASYRDGVMKITFAKTAQAQPKKIQVKSGR